MTNEHAQEIQDLKYIIESLIFVSEGPISFDKIKNLLPEFEPETLRTAISNLTEEYNANKNSFCIREVAGGYQFRTKNEYKKWISLMIQPPQTKISKAALETLAIIAYKQPIIRSEIEHIRGVDSGGVLRILLEKNLVKILGRKEIPGRPLIYVTTKHFLEVFGLKDLKSLPTPKEIEAFQKPMSGDKQEKNKQEQMELPGMNGLGEETDFKEDTPVTWSDEPFSEDEDTSSIEVPSFFQKNSNENFTEKKWTVFAEKHVQKDDSESETDLLESEIETPEDDPPPEAGHQH